MINVTMTESGKKLSLRIEGHAGYAEEGKDIICASVSILASVFAVTILECDEVYEVDSIVDLTSGNAIIECNCKSEETYVKVANAYHYTKLGFKLIAHDYSQYVRLIES
jgi:uncharacterized protein YsxB (DUF464 family)